MIDNLFKQINSRNKSLKVLILLLRHSIVHIVYLEYNNIKYRTVYKYNTQV